MSTLPHAVVWTEIPVRDLEAGMAFYAALFGAPLARDDTGPNPIATFPMPDMMAGIGGHLYVGEPATEGEGPTVHLGLAGPVEEAMARCTRAGGTVLSAVVAIPPGRFAYARDPDGNSIGLFEPAG